MFTTVIEFNLTSIKWPLYIKRADAPMAHVHMGGEHIELGETIQMSPRSPLLLENWVRYGWNIKFAHMRTWRKCITCCPSVITLEWWYWKELTISGTYFLYIAHMRPWRKCIACITVCSCAILVYCSMHICHSFWYEKETLCHKFWVTQSVGTGAWSPK